MSKIDNNFLNFDNPKLEFTFDQKCTAICEWAKHSPIDFDTDMVKSIHANAKKYGKPTHNQMRAINNIIMRYKISVSRWCL